LQPGAQLCSGGLNCLRGLSKSLESRDASYMQPIYNETSCKELSSMRMHHTPSGKLECICRAVSSLGATGSTSSGGASADDVLAALVITILVTDLRSPHAEAAFIASFTHIDAVDFSGARGFCFACFEAAAEASITLPLTDLLQGPRGRLETTRPPPANLTNLPANPTHLSSNPTNLPANPANLPAEASSSIARADSTAFRVDAVSPDHGALDAGGEHGGERGDERCGERGGERGGDHAEEDSGAYVHEPSSPREANRRAMVEWMMYPGRGSGWQWTDHTRTAKLDNHHILNHDLLM